LGDDIPLGVYRDWRKWCKLPHYFFDDPTAVEMTQRFASITLPMAATVATDDLWALPASRDAFFKGYSASPIERIDHHPEALGVAAIGHMGYFRAAVGAQLWPKIMAWLAGEGLRLRDQTG
jgi:predicted alpha/beta hydrolase